MKGISYLEKNVVVLGVADDSSIAWSIARAFSNHGARVHIGYQQKFFSRIRLLLREFPSIRGDRCDVLKDDEVAAFFSGFKSQPIDVLVHAVAYGPPEIFTHYPSDSSMDAFAETLDISSYSLCKIVRYAKSSLRDWASVITLSFQASKRAVPFYGLMGVAKSVLESLVRYLALELGERRVRINAISPGPIETLAALGETMAFIRDSEALSRQRGTLFRTAIDSLDLNPNAYCDELDLARAAWKHVQESFAAKCAIEETVNQEDVANCALFLGSPFAKKITGQVIHVDCGLSTSLIL